MKRRWNFNIKKHIFIHVKLSSAKWRPFSPGGGDYLRCLCHLKWNWDGHLYLGVFQSEIGCCVWQVTEHMSTTLFLYLMSYWNFTYSLLEWTTIDNPKRHCEDLHNSAVWRASVIVTCLKFCNKSSCVFNVYHFSELIAVWIIIWIKRCYICRHVLCPSYSPWVSYVSM